MEKICYCKICGTLDYAHGYCPKCGSSEIVAANHDFLYTGRQKCQSGEFGYDAGLRSFLVRILCFLLCSLPVLLLHCFHVVALVLCCS